MGVAEFKDLALDAVDHQVMADWWCSVLGYARRPAPTGSVEAPPEWPVPIHDPRGHGPLIWVVPVEEAKTAKNRMHLDVWGDAADILALGATLVRRRDAQRDWDVLADPEGNEFCVFARDPHANPPVRLRVR